MKARMKKLLQRFVGLRTAGLAAIVALFAHGASAVSWDPTHIWTGNAGDGIWQTPGNWDVGTVPTSTSTVGIPDGTWNIKLTADVEIYLLRVNTDNATSTAPAAVVDIDLQTHTLNVCKNNSDGSPLIQNAKLTIRNGHYLGYEVYDWYVGPIAHEEFIDLTMSGSAYNTMQALWYDFRRANVDYETIVDNSQIKVGTRGFYLTLSTEPTSTGKLVFRGAAPLLGSPASQNVPFYAGYAKTATAIPLVPVRYELPANPYAQAPLYMVTSGADAFYSNAKLVVDSTLCSSSTATYPLIYYSKAFANGITDAGSKEAFLANLTAAAELPPGAVLSLSGDNKTLSVTLAGSKQTTISFDGNGNTGGSTASVTAKAGMSTQLTANGFTKTGYGFAGWAETASGAVMYANQYTVTDDDITAWGEAKTLYAKWTANKCTVSFNANGGTGGQSATVQATYDAAMPTISTTAPTKAGYTFGGWYDAATGGTQYYTAAGASARTWNKTANTTLYAHWTAKTYTVSLDKNATDATAGTASVTATYGAAMPSATMPTREGYVFQGYYDAETGGNQYYTGAGASARNWDKDSASVTLYARWMKELDPGDMPADWGYVRGYDKDGTNYVVYVYTNPAPKSGTMSFRVPSGVTSLDYLVVGGGGGGGGTFGGGGGAGGFVEGAVSSDLAPSYVITVGPGGAGVVDDGTVATVAGDSSFGSIIAKGGGCGGNYYMNGVAGASGGGGGVKYTTAGTATQGYKGGTGYSKNSAGGGGGAGDVGGAGTAAKSGDGGPGKTSDITGVTCQYAGGGGGCGDEPDGAVHGVGSFGGGDGGAGTDDSGCDASTPGSGGGGAGRIKPYGASGHGGRGADGIVVVRYEVASTGSIWVYNVDSATKYLGGFTSVSNAVTWIESQTGTKFLIELPDADPNDSTKPFVTKEGDSGVYVKTSKSLRIVGGCDHSGEPNAGPTEPAWADHNVESSYRSEIQNCRFDLFCHDGSFELVNVKLTGESLITKGKPNSSQRGGLDEHGDEFVVGRIAVSNCFCSVVNVIDDESVFGSHSSCNFLVLFHAKDMGGVKTLVLMDNTIFFPDAQTISKPTCVVGGAVAPTTCEIVGNTFGSAAMPMSGRVMDGEYDWDLSLKLAPSGDWFLLASNVIHMTDRKGSSEASLINLSFPDVTEVPNPVTATMRDNEIYYYAWEADTATPKSVADFANFCFFGTRNYTYITKWKTDVFANHLNGYCYNRGVKYATGGIVDKGLDGQFIWNNQKGHDYAATKTLSGGLAMLDGAAYSNDFVTSESDWTLHEVDTTHYCENCSTLGHRVTLDAGEGTWTKSGAELDLVTNQTFATQFRSEPLSPGKLVLADADLPTKDSKTPTKWHDSIGGNDYTTAQLRDLTVASSMALTAQYTISLEGCYAYFYERDYWYPNKVETGHTPTHVSVTNAEGEVLYTGPVADQFTCTIYTNATMAGESFETVNVALQTYYVTLTAKKDGLFSGTTGTAAPWTLDRVKYEFTGSGEKTWRASTGFWTVPKPDNYITASGQSYPNSRRDLFGHWASLTSSGGQLTVALEGTNCVDELYLNGDMTIVGDPNSTEDALEVRAWDFTGGATAENRNTYVLRDVEFIGSDGDRFNIHQRYTTVIVEGTNIAHLGCAWRFIGEKTDPKRAELVFRNGTTTLESYFTNDGAAGVTNAISFTNATLYAGFTDNPDSPCDVAFKLGELNKSQSEDANAAVWSGPSIYLASGSSLTIDATEKGVGTYRLVKTNSDPLKNGNKGLGWPDAITNATIVTAAGYRGKLVLTDAKTLDLVVMPVLKTAEDGHEIAVEPDWLAAMFPGVTTLEGWNTQFQAKNNAGVAAWEAYVLGLETTDEWNALSMIVAQGAATATGVTITIPASDQALLDGKTPRLAEGTLPGVSAIKYELIGSENSGMSGALAIDAKYLDGENLREGPSFDYNLVEGMADATVRFFKIRRVYTFDNQE